jgi:hypothetical protein
MGDGRTMQEQLSGATHGAVADDCMDAGGRATHGAVAERGNDEQAKLLLMFFALQISETYDSAIAYRRTPYVIWDSSGMVFLF